MGILSNIFHKIFPSSHPEAAQPPASGAPSMQRADTPAAAPTAAPAATTATATVDVEAILNAKAAQAGQPLNWRTSIVDLLKLLDLDSSLAARKELAQELHYSGDSGDSAAMNVWLQKQVMKKLAENGGKVPAELRD
ncbi:DUF3597 domain-containing protein [Massilia sp. SR12]|jgi:hypothetical protein